MKPNNLIAKGLTVEYLNECFTYIDGKIYWSKRPTFHFKNVDIANRFNTKHAGKEAGSRSQRYLNVHLGDFGIVLAHRIIYFMHTGVWPNCVDHINGDSFDNRIENLRQATKSQNGMNSVTRKSASGVKGVVWHKSCKAWTVDIRVEGKRIYLGSYKDFDEAVATRKQAETEHYGEFANDR